MSRFIAPFLAVALSASVIEFASSRPSAAACLNSDCSLFDPRTATSFTGLKFQASTNASPANPYTRVRVLFGVTNILVQNGNPVPFPDLQTSIPIKNVVLRGQGISTAFNWSPVTIIANVQDLNDPVQYRNSGLLALDSTVPDWDSNLNEIDFELDPTSFDVFPEDGVLYYAVQYQSATGDQINTAYGLINPVSRVPGPLPIISLFGAFKYSRSIKRKLLAKRTAFTPQG